MSESITALDMMRGERARLSGYLGNLSAQLDQDHVIVKETEQAIEHNTVLLQSFDDLIALAEANG